jgi:hypothetical protein
MICLITGLPGNGKTLYALQWVKDKAEKEGRPVFYARIKGLKLPWTLIDPFKWFECPANASRPKTRPIRSPLPCSASVSVAPPCPDGRRSWRRICTRASIS